MDKIEKRRLACMGWCLQNDCGYEVLSDFQIRIYTDDKMVDIYLVNFRYHDLDKNERGSMKFNKRFTEFLDSYLLGKSINID